jgi:membrane-bound lytic murein transglycosylase D
VARGVVPEFRALFQRVLTAFGVSARTRNWLLPLGLAALTAGASASAQTPPPAQPVTAPRPVGASLGEESPSLASLRAIEQEADDRAAAANSAGTVAQAAARDGTTLGADTLPADLAARLTMPDIPMRMTARLARELGLFRTEARARRLLASWVRKSNRYRHRIQQTLLREGLPASLVWVAGAESAFDPRAESSVGAAGLWQFMPDAGRTYGLRVDAWVDERRDPDRSTLAAARYLRDLRARFGTWELAFAAYNVGYNALLRAIRKYNTNDFDALASLEAGLPVETIRYVPRILSFAIASTNPAAFELGDTRPDPVVAWDDVELSTSVPLSDLAREASITEADLRALNPALLRTRTPPCDNGATFVLHVPQGQGDGVRAALTRLHLDPVRAYAVRQGETLDDVAARYDLRPSALLAMSGLTDASAVRPGVTLMTPERAPVSASLDARPVVAVDTEVEPGAVGTQRVFVRVASAEDVPVVARALGVSASNLARWNHLDPRARIQPGMWVQAWVSGDPNAAVRVWREDELEVVHRGSEAFHDRAVAETGLVRVRVTVRDGDTLDTLARRFHVTPGRIARINHLERTAALSAGTVLVVYAAPEHVVEAREERSAAAP